MLLEHERNYDLGTACAGAHAQQVSGEKCEAAESGTSATVPWLRATFCTASAAGPKVLKARANLTLQGKNALEKPVRGIPLHVRPNGWAEG